MTVTQCYELANDVTKQVIGEAVILAEDLSNIVDVGTAVFNNNSFDKYCGALIDKVGKMVFVNRPYSGFAPKVMRDGWEWGAVLQKVSSVLPDAVENEDWNLQSGTSYDPNVFQAPTVINKFFSKYVTYEIDRSITEDQLKSAFNSAAQFNGFVSMIFNEIDKSMTIKADGLIMTAIDSMIADTIQADYAGASTSAASHVKAVNLLYLYNQKFGTELAAADALTNPEFIRFAAYTMSMYKDRLSGMSKLFNIGAQARFTPATDLHVVMLSEFSRAADTYLQADTFHDEMVAMPKHEIVPFWQGSGTGYDFADTSAINVTSGSGNAISQTGILAVMFDHDAIAVTNTDDKVNTSYNPKANFTTYFYKKRFGLYSDVSEQFVVFFVA